jgi:dTDP-4-amino-4,6-dideoxygalactose transaminase
VPETESVARDLKEILTGGRLTNGAYVRELEERVGAYLRVRHCIAVSSCTSGLMLALRAAQLEGEVVVPSFTFSATVHAVVWSGLRPVFADIEPQTLTLSAADVGRVVTESTSAVLATHTYGTPCNVAALSEVSRGAGVETFFDAAHALGSRVGENRVGSFGRAEVFSLSPTKVLVASEGGLITTADDALAERLRMGRDYGDSGDYDCVFPGLNARMSEIHAAIALASLDGLEDRIAKRNTVADRYRATLDEVAGVTFPLVPSGSRSTYKDVTVVIERDEFGIDAPMLQRALAAENIETRRYYHPPVHRMRAYEGVGGNDSRLPVTDWASERVLSLPIGSDVEDDTVVGVARAIARIQGEARSIRETLLTS